MEKRPSIQLQNLKTFLEVLSVKPVNVLHKWLKTFYFDPQLLKAQTKYLGRNWRKSNMKTMSAIYQKVRHRLNDDWAYGNGMWLSGRLTVYTQQGGETANMSFFFCVCVFFWVFFCMFWQRCGKVLSTKFCNQGSWPLNGQEGSKWPPRHLGFFHLKKWSFETIKMTLWVPKVQL